jgi:hypothetical protein
MVPVERIELPTFGLQNRCSTAELNRRTLRDFNNCRFFASGHRGGEGVRRQIPELFGEGYRHDLPESLSEVTRRMLHLMQGIKIGWGEAT